ncbi:MAG: L-fucose:H+ symporter permease [Chlorobi bacterium]|nr:L-fucose:H+ symporter permease [Chlorobiota bacterium]
MVQKSKSGFITPGNLFPFILVTVLFFLWGIPNNLNGILIKQFMKSLELSVFEAGLVQSAFYMGYFLMAVPAALLMERYGYKTGIVFGLLLFSLGCILFWPAVHIGTYGFFLLVLFIIASGLAFLETGANPFIALLGDDSSSERRLNFAQAFNPLGAIAGVMIGTVFIFSGNEPDIAEISVMKAEGIYTAFLHNEIFRILKPYIFLSAFALFWAILIIRTKFPEFRSEKNEKISGKIHFTDLIHYRSFIKGVTAQFFYVGAQVATWSYFIVYVQTYTGVPEKLAGYLLTGTLVSFGIGRFSATYLMRRIQPARLMGLYSFINIILAGISIIVPGWIGLWALFLTSFFMSLMYPTIFAMTIKGLGAYTKIGGSVLVMAIIGGALLTPLTGWIGKISNSIALAMIIPLIAYLYIFYFSVYEYRHSRLMSGNISKALRSIL